MLNTNVFAHNLSPLCECLVLKCERGSNGMRKIGGEVRREGCYSSTEYMGLYTIN
jgi:hypothetical protein